MKKIVYISLFSTVIFVAIIMSYLYTNNLWIFNPFNNADVDVEYIIKKLADESEFSNAYIMEKDEVKEKYNIDENDNIQSFAVLTSFMNIEALEVAMFKFSNKDEINNFKETIINRAKEIFKYYDGYMYSEAEISKDYEIKEYNDAVLFVIHKNKEKVIKYIEKLILEK